MTEHVAIENIQRVFTQGARDLHVLRGASLALAAGEVVALVGPSGSGKSSLLQIVGLLEKPDGGAISLRGQLLKWIMIARERPCGCSISVLSIKLTIRCPSFRRKKISLYRCAWPGRGVMMPCKMPWSRWSVWVCR